MKFGFLNISLLIKSVFILLIMLTTVNIFWWKIKWCEKEADVTTTTTYFNHFRLNRNLKEYIQEIELLSEPSTPPCGDGKSVILVTVASNVLNVDQRNAIRTTWATYLPTLFVIGLDNPDEMYTVPDLYNDDLIIYKFQDHYQNLTLKTALMLKWVGEKCSSKIQFMLKTDDDVLLNPWQLTNIVQEKSNADLIGFIHKNAAIYHYEGYKWYIPCWLYAEDTVPEYLAGNAYLIKENHIQNIFKAAFEVPLINIEDIYFTFLVAKRKLGLNLTHEPRLRGFKPWLPLTYSYWNQASIHGMIPKEMIKWWLKLVAIADELLSRID